MGYTNYWKQNKIEEMPKDFVAKVNKIFDIGQIPLANGRGSFGTKPEANNTRICFNGVGENSHETCYLGIEEEGFNFCKTACKPYDLIVKAVLLLAEEYGVVYDVSWDGPAEDADEARKLLGAIKCK